MKKTVHSRSRSRWLVGGILFIGAAALAGTGFSVWVVSNSVVETQGDIGINYVDTANNDSVQLNATISETESLTITETYTDDDYKGTGTCYVTNAGVDDHDLDLSVTISDISVAAGTSWLNDNTVTGLEVSIAAWQYQTTDDEGEAAWKDATTTGTDLISSRTSGTELTYIELDTDTTKLEFGNRNFSATSGSSNATYTATTDWTVKFKWGSFFNGVSPCNYYNTILNTATTDGGVEPTTENLDKVTTELNTMHDNLSGSVITLTVKLVTSATTAGE